VSGEEEPEDLQAGLRAKSGEAIGGTSDEEGIRLLHISIIAVIRKYVKP
jgi:hypothetical protein